MSGLYIILGAISARYFAAAAAIRSACSSVQEYPRKTSSGVISALYSVQAIRERERAKSWFLSISRLRNRQSRPAFAMFSVIAWARAVLPNPGAPESNTSVRLVKPPAVALSMSYIPVGIGSKSRVLTSCKKESSIPAPVRFSSSARRSSSQFDLFTTAASSKQRTNAFNASGFFV